jgi:hypothetical protein
MLAARVTSEGAVPNKLERSFSANPRSNNAAPERAFAFLSYQHRTRGTLTSQPTFSHRRKIPIDALESQNSESRGRDATHC